MPEFEGEVEAVSFKKSGWSVKIGENWFSGRGGDCPKKGDFIQGEYEDKQWNDRVFHNVKTFKIVTPGEQPQTQPKPNTGDKIVRQACLKAAAPIVAATIRMNNISTIKQAQDWTIKIAEEFKKYVERGVDETGNNQ